MLRRRCARPSADRAWLAGDARLRGGAGAAPRRGPASIPPRPRETIAAACGAGALRPRGARPRGARGRQPRRAARARAHRAPSEGDAAGYVHWGATSQDVIDTAAMLVGPPRARSLIDDRAGRASPRHARRWRDEHRGTPMPGRTLLQQALPITFGLKAAGWLSARSTTRAGGWPARCRLAVQLGGAAGTLASLGARGHPRAGDAWPRSSGSDEPVLPWHTDRGAPGASSAAALALAAGRAGEDRPGRRAAGPDRGRRGGRAGRRGRGGSSTLPHKRNPVGAVRADRVRAARARRGVASCWAPWPRSTSAPPAPGRPSGRRSASALALHGRRGRGAARGAGGARGPARRGCARTSTLPAACCSPRR